MATSLRELRAQTDLFFDGVFAEAMADPEFWSRAESHIAPHRMEALPGWPEPDRRMKFIADRAVTQAWHAVKRAAEEMQLSGIPTGFMQYPLARFEFSEGDVPDFAPLLASCLDGVIYGGLVRVVLHAQSRLTRSRERIQDGDTVRVDLYPGADGVALMKRANAFLETEMILWDLARTDSGFRGVVPYPVRYESARFLWSPRIAGAAFCLRCGESVRYRRAGRSSGRPRRIPTCSSCSRGAGLAWPKHAVMPHGRGEWWLMCHYPGCTNAFAGPGQAHLCPEHRSARLARSKRRRPSL
jgi:hypothetical protein